MSIGKFRLLEVTQAQLATCVKNIEDAEQKIKEYRELISELSTLPDQLKYEKMIPIGSLAFMPGFLINTNNIQVYLADGYIIETSAKSAAEIAQRQVKRYEDLISKLTVEKEKHEKWIYYINETSTNNECKDIVEFVTEEEYEDMKNKHKESVRKYRQQLNASEISFENLDESIDDVELAQIKTPQTNKKQDDNSLEKINAYIEKMKITQNEYKMGKNTPSIKEESSINSLDKPSAEEESTANSVNKPSYILKTKDATPDLKLPDDDVKKKVRWREEAEEEIPKIYFHHTSFGAKVPRSHDEPKHLSSPQSIHSPSDIYTTYLITKAKPILKVPKDFVPNTCKQKTTQKNKVINKSTSNSAELKPFSREVKETSSSSPVTISLHPERQQKQSLFKKMNKK